MINVDTQTTLTPKDYPEYEQTVGNSFASSYPDAVEKDETELSRLANVSQGLFKIYETVVEDAAKGAPLTPRDSAVIATTVANMTSSVGVESTVEPMVSLESRYDQHIGYIITQESISETIKKTIVSFCEVFMRLLTRIAGWVKQWISVAQDHSRPLLRFLNTVKRLDNLTVARTKYTPSMSGILVDNQLPASWLGSALKTLNCISAMTKEQLKMLSYGESILAEVARIDASKDSALSQVEAIKKKVSSAAVVSLGNFKDRTESYADKQIDWSEPLCGNVIAIAMNPKNGDAIDAANYGAALVPLDVAAEFGVKTKYASSAEPTSDTYITIDPMDYSRCQKPLASVLNSRGGALRELNDHIDKLEASLKTVTDKFSKLNIDTDDEHGLVNDSAQDLLTYAGVARSVVSAAVASARYNYDAYANTTESIGAVFKAFNS